MKRFPITPKMNGLAPKLKLKPALAPSLKPEPKIIAPATEDKFSEISKEVTADTTREIGIEVPKFYVFKKKLGEGGQGQVWLVEERTYHGNVISGSKKKAWKFIKDYGHIDELIREAEAATGFGHENVGDVDPLMFVPFSMFPLKIQDSIRNSSKKELNWDKIDIPVLSMKYIDGFQFGQMQVSDLGGWFTRLKNWRGGQREKWRLMPMHTLGFIISRALRGLEYINSRDKIHRDIKPGNILINSQGVVKLTDFALMDFEKSLGSEKYICGTVAYMSPEQMRGEKLDKTTDVYSLGMVAYEGMTGGLPHYDMTPNARNMDLQAMVNAFYSNARNGYPDFHRKIKDISRNFPITVDGKTMPYGEWFTEEFCNLVDAMLEFNPEHRPTPAEAVNKLEGIIYRGLAVPGPTNPALANLGLLYQYDKLTAGDMKPAIRSLLHLCRDPEKTKKALDAGEPLAREDYPQITRPCTPRAVQSDNPKETYSAVKLMRQRTETAHTQKYGEIRAGVAE